MLECHRDIAQFVMEFGVRFYDVTDDGIESLVQDIISCSYKGMEEVDFVMYGLDALEEDISNGRSKDDLLYNRIWIDSGDYLMEECE